MTPEGGGTVHLHTEDIELAGEVLQDLCAALQLTEIESTADFPQEMEAFRAVMLKVCNGMARHVTVLTARRRWRPSARCRSRCPSRPCSPSFDPPSTRR